MREKIKSIIKWTLRLTLAGTAFIILVVGYVQFSEIFVAKNKVDQLETVPYIIVLGASVREDGTPSDALYDRVLAGVEAYKAGKGEKLLMTGDNGAFHVNEVETMGRIASEAGVPTEDVLIDGQGYRTYESCKRAAQIIGIKQAIIVTQRFHLGRALFLCKSFGIDVQGLSADRRAYKKIVFFTFRDLAASFKAWVDVYIWSPKSPVET